ncbi:unnamed protein product [Spirodela intermedia]|uniref:Protein kinase domain-containing protein n=1 Tax=Spirodela intermedia TaxID=51605 RepID=A0A7I8KPG4_SPIIN|nr:unnamed protein product [Spirodela intermedia]
MLGDAPSSSGQRFPHNYIPSKLGGVQSDRHLSVQTGEECSMEFLHDRAASRGPPVRPNADRFYTKRMGLNYKPNLHQACEDLTGFPGLRRTESDCVSDVERSCRMKMDGNRASHHARAASEEAIPSPFLAISIQELRSHPCSAGSINGLLQPDKLKFLCSFGGKILPRPSDGKLRYVGGETRIISTSRNPSWVELMQKTQRICNQCYTIKYQLPEEDLDALISVSTDEDLQNMLEEYRGLDNVNGSQRIRIFLIVSNEAENSSCDARIAQNRSEYQYVAAVNGISPGKSSSGDSPNQLEHALDGSLILFHESLGSHLSSDIVDGRNTSSPDGIYLNRPSQAFLTSQTATPTLSPPFSPRQVDPMDSRIFGKQSTYEQPLTDQSFENHDGMEDGRRTYGFSKHLPYLHNDAEVSKQPHGIHFKHHIERPAHEERAFHSEMLSKEQNNLKGISSGSNEFVGSNLGIPHAFSDPVLPDHAGNSSSSQEEGTLLPLSFSKPQFAQKSCRENMIDSTILESKEINKLQVIKSEYADSFEFLDTTYMNLDYSDKRHQEDNVYYANSRPQYYNGPRALKHIEEKGALLGADTNIREGDAICKTEVIGSNDHKIGFRGAHLSSQELDALERCVPASSFIVSGSSSSIEEHFSCNQTDHAELGILVSDYKTSKSQPSSFSGELGGNNEYKAERIIGIRPHYSWVNSSSEIFLTDKYPVGGMEEQRRNENSSEIASVSSSTNSISLLSPGIIPVDSSSLHESEVSSSTTSVPLVLFSKDDQSLNLCTDDPPNRTSPQSPPIDQTLMRGVSLLDQDSLNHPSPQVQATFDSKSQKTEYRQLKTELNDKAPIKGHVAVKDVTAGVSSDIPLSPTIVPRVTHQATREVDVYNTSSITLEYECEIIKNADLEELRELGSGTFGTVYHGKWRGTDVAIKRIRKSCFSGRTSEQERLTKDFWREAHILSKLHHPNVVAFYGVVPDGAGGTLATVTEYMVNGSLRHVLIRKDRSLDRRKRLMIAMDAAFGMEYLHSKNIVHFDLKCDNLLVNMRDPQRPICKVGDFGLSRIKRNTLVSGGVRGTLPWMAPELLNGSSNRVSEKVDVFSFGIALWEILTGEEPYANMHCGAIIGGIVSNTLRPPIPDYCDPEWKRLMEQCWSPDPAARPSFTEITHRLRSMSMALQTKRS